MRRRRFLPDVACLAVLALVIAAFFWPLLVAGRWIPRGGGDLVSFIWPMYRFAARSLRGGEIPLWNPFLYSGAPFVADNQSGVFYPINLLVTLLFGEPSYVVIEGLVLFHMWLAGAGVYALGRVLRLRRLAGLLGGAAFGLSDLFVTHVGNLNLNASAAWLPLLLTLTHRALIGGGLGWAAGAGAVLAVTALAGHGQMLLVAVLALGLYVLYRLIVDIRAGQRRSLSTLGLAAVMAVVGVGGAALALLPAHEMAGHTGRGHLPFQEATRYSLPPAALIGLLAPGFYGRGVDGFWGPWDRVEVGYVGVVTLVLAALGSGLRPGGKELGAAVQRFGSLRGFFTLLVPLTLLLAMGSYTPLYALVYRWVPAFDQVRAPARLIVLADLGLAVLAAYGFHRVLESGRSDRVLWTGAGALIGAGALLAVGLPGASRIPPVDRIPQATASVLVATALLGLSGLILLLSRGHRGWAWLLLLLLPVDLVGLGSSLEVEVNDPTLGFRHEDVIEFLRRDASLYRIEGAARAWQPDAALVYGLYDIGGIYNPLGLAPYGAYRWAVGDRGSPLYDLLGVKYILSDKDHPPGGEEIAPVYSENPAIDVYLNTGALPRALLVYRSRVVPDHAAAWEAIHAPAFNPAEVVVLEHGEELSGEPGDGERYVSVARYGLNEVEIVAQTPIGGYLVLSDVYYPGWKVTVDGRPAEVMRANYVFRAVQLGPGEHRLKFTFTPWTWRVGVTVSVITWLGMGASAAILLARRRR